jgi:hypothetical protein
MHPTSPAKRSPAKTSPADASQARLAAEAAFSEPLPTPGPSTDGPVVVVKRIRVVPAGDEDAAGSGDDRPEQVVEARAPKVYRAEPTPRPGLPKGASDESRAPDSLDDSPGNSGDAGASEPVLHSKRRRRPRKHGDVTVIRPDHSEARQTTDPSAQVQNLPTPAAPTDGRAAEIFDSAIETLRRRTLEDCEVLAGKILKLERQAQALKQAEAAHAVRWIRQAVAEYGLTADDLGL